MRYLHPVAVHEKFVASGTYRYTRGGEDTRFAEHWTIHELPDGAWFMRVDKDGRFDDGRSVLIEVWRSPVGVIERFDIMVYGAKGDAVKKVRATYTLEHGVLHAGRTVNDGDRLVDEIVLPEGAAVLPGGLVFAGYEMPKLVDSGALVTQVGFEDGFRAAVRDLAVIADGTEDIKVDGKVRSARRFTAGDVTWWVDDHNIVVRHVVGDVVAQLARYAHRPVQ